MQKIKNSLLLTFMLLALVLPHLEAQNIRLKSEETSRKQNNQFVKTDSIYFNYPNSSVGDIYGNYFSEYYYYQRDSANQVFNGSKTLFQYNANMNDTVRAYYFWDGNAWQLESKWVNQYNASGKLVSASKYVANQAILIETNRITQAYNSSAHLIERTEQELVSGNLTNKTQRVYGRDAAGNLTELISKNWINNTWENVSRTVNVFLPSSALIDTATRYDWNNNAWRPLGRDLNTYNANGLITLQYVESYNTNLQEFVNYRKNESAYNASEKLALYSEYFWISGSWKLLSEVAYTTYTGDFYGRATRKEFDSNTNQMENRFRWDNIFNQEGWKIKNRQYEWLNSAWEETSFTDYTYEETLLSGVINMKGEKKLLAYPNPFSTNTIIEFESNQTGQANIHITDNTGRVVFEVIQNIQPGNNSILWNAIDSEGKSLPSGVYYFILKGKDTVSTAKLIKQ